LPDLLKIAILFGKRIPQQCNYCGAGMTFGKNVMIKKVHQLVWKSSKRKKWHLNRRHHLVLLVTFRYIK